MGDAAKESMGISLITVLTWDRGLYIEILEAVYMLFSRRRICAPSSIMLDSGLDDTADYMNIAYNQLSATNELPP